MASQAPTDEKVAAKGACNRDAYTLLRKRGLKPARIIEVHTDGVLWLDQRGRAKTTFVTVNGEDDDGSCRVVTHTVAGFVVA